MTHAFVRTVIIGTAFALAVPLWAQRGQGGGGVGRVAGPVTGAAAGAVNSTASQSAGKSGNGASVNTNVGAANRDNGNAGVNSGHGLGASADVSLRVSQNAGLSAQLQPLLPAGNTLAGAADGFRNQGQFISALHVAHNLNIPFDQLKAKLTGDNPVSLGKAIQGLRPAMDDKAIKNNTKLADRQTERDLQQSESAGKPAPFVTRLGSDTALASRLQGLLPKGATLEDAAAGFKNQGQFIATLGSTKQRLLERMWNPTVFLQGSLAVVRAPYDFHIDGAFSHCGVDVFTLVRSKSEWRVTHVVYTVQRQNCAASPLGTPSG